MIFNILWLVPHLDSLPAAPHTVCPGIEEARRIPSRRSLPRKSICNTKKAQYAMMTKDIFSDFA